MKSSEPQVVLCELPTSNFSFSFWSKGSKNFYLKSTPVGVDFMNRRLR